MTYAAFGGARGVDRLGRVVLPLEVRAILGIKDGDQVLFVNGPNGSVQMVKAERSEPSSAGPDHEA